MLAVAHALVRLASMTYGGLVVGFAVLVALYPPLTGRPRAEIARVYRAAGPILGLSMGAWVAGLFWTMWLERGEFTWSLADAPEWTVFAALWVSSFVLEIWTLDPLRATTGAEGSPVDTARFDRAYRRTTAHLCVNAALVVAWVVLSAA